jgi:hypothetical protein
MTGFAMVLVLIIWMLFRPKKSQPEKNNKKSCKKTLSKVKTQAIVKGLVNTEPEDSSDEFMKVNATEIVNPFGPSLPPHGL